MKLCGPVSISQDYTTFFKNRIVCYLREEKRDKSLAAYVHPTNSYRDEMPQELSPRLESIEQVSVRVAESQPDGKGVPVLAAALPQAPRDSS